MISVQAPVRSIEDLLAAVGLAGFAERFAELTGSTAPKCWFDEHLSFCIETEDPEALFDWLCGDLFRFPCYLVPAIKDSPVCQPRK